MTRSSVEDWKRYWPDRNCWVSEYPSVWSWESLRTQVPQSPSFQVSNHPSTWFLGHPSIQFPVLSIQHPVSCILYPVSSAQCPVVYGTVISTSSASKLLNEPLTASKWTARAVTWIYVRSCSVSSRPINETVLMEWWWLERRKSEQT